MHAPASSSRTACGPPIQLGNHLPGAHPFGQGMAMTAMSAKHRIILAQMCTDPRSDRFFSDVGMATSVNDPSLI